MPKKRKSYRLKEKDISSKKKISKNIPKRKRRKRRKIKSSIEKSSGWTIGGRSSRSSRSNSRKARYLKKKKDRKKWSPHIEQKYCTYFTKLFSKYDNPIAEYYRQKKEYLTATYEPKNEYYKCMKKFDKTKYGRLKKTLKKLKNK
tara:strand:- start:47 stop:481 length:435 start_codon:yes stop_codon:yes gene_type:complete